MPFRRSFTSFDGISSTVHARQQEKERKQAALLKPPIDRYGYFVPNKRLRRNIQRPKRARDDRPTGQNGDTAAERPMKEPQAVSWETPCCVDDENEKTCVRPYVFLERNTSMETTPNCSTVLQQ